MNPRRYDIYLADLNPTMGTEMEMYGEYDFVVIV